MDDTLCPAGNGTYPHKWAFLRSISYRTHVFFCAKCLDFKTKWEPR